MLWIFLGRIFSILLSLIRVSRLSENDKELEIIILRHQLDVMVRKQKQSIRPNRAEKATLPNTRMLLILFSSLPTPRPFASLSLPSS